MARADLLVLANRMEHELAPEQYDQDAVCAPEGCGCAWDWGQAWGLHPFMPTPVQRFYELTDEEHEYLFSSRPERDTSLTGTIAALREVASRAP